VQRYGHTNWQYLSLLVYSYVLCIVILCRIQK
jgi:hypothetical protein